MGNLKEKIRQASKKLKQRVAVPMSSFYIFQHLFCQISLLGIMFSCSFIYISSHLRTIFSPPTNQTTLNRQTGRADHLPPSIPPDQAVFLSADLQSRPSPTQQTSNSDHFPRSRPPVQTIFHEADLRPDHDQTTYLPVYQSATSLHRTPNFQTSRSDRFLKGWVKGG